MTTKQSRIDVWYVDTESLSLLASGWANISYTQRDVDGGREAINS